MVVWFIGQSLVFILLAFVLGIIVGRLTARRGKLEETISSAPAKSNGAAGEKAAKPGETADEELERIEGIGPKMADALRAAGIRTFAQLADTDDDTKRRAVNAAGMTFAPSLVTWSRQARLLADGDEEAFAELTARLIAGRDTEVAR
ncbi:hypothetical protein Are01nite_18460 [Actinoplanes regularis]|nr:hypothetical protein Are01nite_18460 [Actinoplanes regularis]